MRIGFKHHKVGNLEYLTIPAFDETGMVSHCFTTRLGGVSTGECESMNLGFNRRDTRENVERNYQIITEVLGINYKDLVFSQQVHEDHIRIVSREDCGKGITKPSDIIGVDGLVTNESGVPLVTFYADCVPLFFLDPVKKVIALVHSGWRGTVKKIGQKAIRTLKEEFGCSSKDILAAIGPSIGSCHFEVDSPVVEEFQKAYHEADEFITYKGNGKYLLDLWEANLQQFEEEGLLDDNITLAGECTYCNKDMYFSHRRDHGRIGSLASIMQLNTTTALARR